MTYGEIHLANGYWAIRCEPHVRAKLKRVFPRAPVHAAEMITILDSIESSRDLLWFTERYPLDISAPLKERLVTRAAEHVDMELKLSDLLASRTSPGEFNLAKPAREYQLIGAAAAELRGGLLLADDVGLGKTVTGICPMAKPENLPAVVVVPAHLPDHWVEKLGEFAPNLRVHTIRKGQPYPLVKQPRQRTKDLWDTLPDVVVISYHKLRGWADTLAEFAKYVVFEECQQLRHPGTDIYRAADYLARRARLRMGLSATPIYNYGSEFYWVCHALLPDSLGSHDEYIREWCVAAPGDKARLKDSEQFGGYLRREGIMLRRTRADVGRELPPLTKIEHIVESDSKVLEQLTGDAVALARIIVGNNEQWRGQKMQAAGEFDQMVRQATGVAKAPYVAEFVRLLVENGHQVLLFGWHREVYGIWNERLADFHPVMYTGTESATQKRAAKEAFISGESRVLIMSLRSGAGVDGLQHVCNTIVFGELDWSPGVHEQCMGRPHRDGQQEACQAYFLVSEEGSDPIVAEVLGLKREQIEGVRNPGENLIERRDIGENQLRHLAQEFLKRRGVQQHGGATVTDIVRPNHCNSVGEQDGPQA